MTPNNSSPISDSTPLGGALLTCDVVRHWAQATPHAPALSDPSLALDYGQLECAIDEISDVLNRRGVVAGDRVLIVAENNIAAVVALFACQRLNAWPAVVNARLPAAELERLHALVEPRLALYAVADSEACTAHASSAGAVRIEGLLAGPIAVRAADTEVAAEPQPASLDARVGLLIFTSGTAGLAKAVMHSHRGLLALGSVLSRSRQLSPTDCYNGVAPLAHIMGIANLMSVVVAGACLRLMARLEEGVQIHIVDTEGADVAEGTLGELWMRAPAAMLGYYRDPIENDMISRSGFNGCPAEIEPAPAPQYTDTQPWLLRAVSTPTRSHFLQAAGVRLHYRSWNANDTAKPVLLFAHGYRANSHWWDFIAPFFVDHFRVYAMDFSGMGESGSRPNYSAQAFTDDLVALLEKAVGPAIVVGHSYGGLRTLRVCADRPDLIRQAVILDSRVRFLDEPAYTFALPPARSGRARHYPDYPTIRQRYRVIPAQPLPLADTFEHVAFHSIANSPQGWHWRLDPALPFTVGEPDGDALLERIEGRVDFVYGEESSVVEHWRAQRIASRLRHCRGAIGIPNSQHHLMLDQPLALVSVLRALLAQPAQLVD